MSVEKLETRIQVGEIISIQRKDSSNRAVGLVRWIKAYGINGIQIGGMLLSPSAVSVGISRIDTENDMANQIIDRCLLLPLMTSLHRPDTILTFSRQYRSGDVLMLNKPGEKPDRIRLEKVSADNGIISQFTFTPIEQQHTQPEQSDSVENSSGLNYFDDIWQRL